MNVDVNLLDLSDLNQKLLRELRTRAPGTYQHSIIVGTMAERTAASIGADSLLAGVGGYYHDIGKLANPHYFIENESSTDTQSGDQSASVRASAIRAHVNDGVELAGKHHLPEAVIDIIREHHGTSLMESFYLRSQAATNGQASEKSFRYSGPKPRTREAALVMLADSAEAASHSLAVPSVVRLESMVREVILKKQGDGQLDNCPIAMDDLVRCEECFVGVLTEVFQGQASRKVKNED